MKNNKFKYVVISLSVVLFIIIIRVYANSNDVSFEETPYASFEVIDNGEQGGKRELQLAVTNIAAGKRLDAIEYCLDSSNCETETNWHDVTAYDNTNIVSTLVTPVGSAELSLSIKTPLDKLNLRAKFVDFEPMDISYAKYNLSTTNEDEYRDIYVDGITDLNNYDAEFTDIVTGYMGGDIILPSGCTNNGCLLKVTFDKDDYDAIVSRLDYYNEHYNQDMDDKLFLDLSPMNNHLDGRDLATDTIIYVKQNNSLYIETEGNTKSIYLIVNKFFSQKNRSDFAIADNKNRILSEDYIGLNYTVNRKYFDEGNNFGFLTFNDFNSYRAQTEIFYGTPKIQLSVDSVVEPALTPGGSKAGMGTIKHPYNKIVSKNQTKFPINSDFELTISSFYEQDYVVPMELKNGEEHVQDIELRLSRFAFGGNAGSLLLVDDKGINCRRQDQNPNCTENNIYVSTEYRGLYDTFYSDGTTSTITAFEISKQHNGIKGDVRNNETVYNRNEDFNPWAVAIFYHNDTVVATKSFDLGEMIVIEGFSEDAIENSEINGIATDFNNQPIANYNSEDYNVFGYGLGYEKPIGRIKYFKENLYRNNNINQTLILASKQEILDNNINKIALFLTNGELKPDTNNFPELTYGVGEGKIFEIDGRTFEELGGGE